MISAKEIREISMMQYKIIISPDAYQGIIDHAVFLANVSRSAATKFRKNIITDINSLKENPQRHSFCKSPEMEDKIYRKMLSEKRYYIIYRIIESTVLVDFVIDCRQDYHWLLG